MLAALWKYNLLSCTAGETVNLKMTLKTTYKTELMLIFGSIRAFQKNTDTFVNVHGSTIQQSFSLSNPTRKKKTAYQKLNVQK